MRQRRGLDEAIAYDNLGNISSLIRGGTGAASLGYNYTVSGNASSQLQAVTNSGSPYKTYSYDGNGNAT